MTEQEIIFTNKKGIKYTAKFSPSSVGGKKVYNFLAKKDGESDFSHYGYMTEAFVQKIISNRPDSESKYIESLELVENKIGKKSKQKIILDLPSKVNEKSFFGQGSSMKRAGFSLVQTFYKTELYPAITIKPNANFKVDVVDNLRINSRNHFLECDNFIISGLIDSYANTIDFEIEKSKAGNINIIEARSVEEPWGEKLYLAITANERADIDIKHSSFIARQENEEHSELVSRGYVPIIANGNIKIVDSRIDIPSHVNVNKNLSLNGYALVSKGSININHSLVFFGEDKERPTIIRTEGNMDIVDTTIIFCGYNHIDGALKVARTKESQTKAVVSFDNIKVKSPIQYQSSDGENARLDIACSTIDNGKYPIILKESIFISDTNIYNDNSKEGSLLNFKDCYIGASHLSNISDLINAHIGYSQLENFTLNNKNEKNKTSFIFGFASNISRENIPENQKAVMKNCNVELGENDNFSTWGNEKDSASFTNCSFSGNFQLRARPDYRDISYNLSSQNSIYDRAVINIKSDVTEINNSEIRGSLSGEALTLINNSVVSYSSLENIKTIEDSYLEDYNASPYETNLKRFNSVSGTFDEDMNLSVNKKLELL